MEPIKVVCGIIWKDGKILLARKKAGKSLAGFWEFPGGKVESNEDPQQALTRELEEEMRLRMKIKRFIGSHIYAYETFRIELLGYECVFESADFVLTDHDAVEFVLPKDINSYKIAPADFYFVDKLF